MLHITLNINYLLFVDIHHHVRQSIKPSLQSFPFWRLQFKQLRICTTSLIPTFYLSTGIRIHTFKLTASGPQEEGTVVNKSTASNIKLQSLHNTSTVMHIPSRFTTFTLRLALRHSSLYNCLMIISYHVCHQHNISIDIRGPKSQ